MQTVLKVSFWFSVVLAILASCLGGMVGDYVALYLMVAVFGLPGLFIKARLYQVAPLLIFCAYLLFAYQDHLAGKRRAAWREQLDKKA